MRPVARSTPVAGRSALRPRVAATGELHAAPSDDDATNAAFVVVPAAAQSCHAAQMRPEESTSAEGSANALNPRTAQRPSTSAIRTGAAHAAPPSVESDEAIAVEPFVSNR